MAKTKFEEMMDRLPSNIKETDILRLESKKVLAALLDLLLHSKAKETKVIFVNNTKLRKMAGIGSCYLLSAIKQLEDYELITRKVGEGNGKASEYIINFKKLKEPLVEKTFDDLFGEMFEDTKSPETPISTTITIPITTTITNTITTSTTIANTTSIENTKEESFIDEFEQKEGVSLNRYLYNLFKKEGIESIENWYNTNASKFKSTNDFKRYNSIASAINGEAYKVASRLNEVGARASRQFSKQMAASMRGVEIGSAI